MIKRFVPMVFFVIIALLPASAVCLDFQPGKYQVTSTVEMPGMTMPAQTFTQCLTEQSPVPNKSMGDQGCAVSDMKTTKNTVSWQMVCDQQGRQVTMVGEMTYAGDSFNGVMTTKMGPEAGNMTIKTTISGKRIGTCQ